MTLQEYISFWQETYDKHQSRPTTYAAHNYAGQAVPYRNGSSL